MKEPFKCLTYTTAPADLDWAFSRELDPSVGRMGTVVVRLVETGTFFKHQRKRYRIHGYLAVGKKGWETLLQEGRARRKRPQEDNKFMAWLRESRMTLTEKETRLGYEAFVAGRTVSF